MRRVALMTLDFSGTLGFIEKLLKGEGLPNKTIDLGEEYGKLPLITIGDSAFPRFPWLLKGFSTNTNDSKEKLYNLKLKSARVVTENVYGMLKSQWRILYKKTEMKIYNLKYIVMACVMLHNLCIARNDPCNPRWRLTVKKLELNGAQQTFVLMKTSWSSSSSSEDVFKTSWPRRICSP